MNVTNIIANEVPNKGLTELTTEEQGLVKQVIEYIHGKNIVIQNSPLMKKYETTVFGHKEHEEPSDNSLKITQINRFIKYNDQLKVSLFKSTDASSGNTSYIARAFALVEDKGETKKQIVTTFDGELLADVLLETDETKLDITENFAQLSEEEIGETDFEAQDVPCIQNGCCSFRYNGLPWNPLVVYNWCGAGCGSGTPVNALDRCCRTHDGCYGDIRSYPGRCSCDRTLISCASKTDNAGTDRIIAGFQAKMLPLC